MRLHSPKPPNFPPIFKHIFYAKIFTVGICTNTSSLAAEEISL